MKNGRRKKEDRGAGRIGFAFSIFSLCIVHSALCISVFAQDEPAPPPLKIITKQERMLLEAKSDIKDRTKLAIEMMTARITAAEQFRTREDFDAVFRELGVFHGLLENALDYLLKRDTGSGKVLDNFKRLEIGLRAFAPRIEAMRREMPLRYDEYLLSLLKNVREARTKAVDPLFDDSVVRQKKADGI